MRAKADKFWSENSRAHTEPMLDETVVSAIAEEISDEQDIPATPRVERLESFFSASTPHAIAPQTIAAPRSVIPKAAISSQPAEESADNRFNVSEAIALCCAGRAADLQMLVESFGALKGGHIAAGDFTLRPNEWENLLAAVVMSQTALFSPVAHESDHLLYFRWSALCCRQKTPLAN